MKSFSSVRQLGQDFSISAMVAGILAVLISFAGPIVIVFQAGQLAHLTTAQMSSWIWAISLGSGITGLGLSWFYKTPIVTAWSTPGAALLVTMLPNYPYEQAIGAYIFAGLLITLIGITGVFDELIARIPKGIAAAMLAGILLRFGMESFSAISINPLIVAPMIATYIAMKRVMPRYAIAAVMLVGTGMAIALGETQLTQLKFAFVTPVWTSPSWSWHALIGLGVPLALVTLTGQYVPGMAVLRTAGYSTPAKTIVGTTGIASILLSPFGLHGVNLAAITAAICTGTEAHPKPDKRYIAGIFSGFTYIVIGTFGGALALLFSSLPHVLLATLAGLALIGTITSGLLGAVQDEAYRDASMITFLATASGVQWLGLGAAFWGLCFGAIAGLILRK